MSATAPSVHFRSALRRAMASLQVFYQVVLGEPMEEGRLSLDGLDRVSRQLAIGGLLALGGMLVSSVLVELWRKGPLISIGTTSEPAFLPQALVPLTLVALFLAWLVIFWGALRAALWARLVTALAFVVLDGALARPRVLAAHPSFGLRWGPDLALWGYALAPAVLVLLPETRRLPGLKRYVGPASQVALLAAAGLFFGAVLWAQAGAARSGSGLYIPSQLYGAMLTVQGVLVPMVFVSVLAIIELSYSISEAVSGPFWRLSPFVAKACLLALVGVKIWRELASSAGDWLVYLEQRPAATIRTLLGLALLAGLSLLAHRLRPDARASERVKERVAYVAAFVLALPLLVAILVYAFGEFLVGVFSATGASGYLVRNFPSDWVGLTSPVFWAGVLGTAIVLLARSRRRQKGQQKASREAALGLIVMAVWAEYLLVPEALHYAPGFNAVLLDAALTVAVAAYVMVRWRAITAHAAVWLGALVGFSWLLSTQGDFITLLGGLFGLPAVVLLVVGVVYTLLTDSEFTRKASATLPGGSRQLIWIGYLLLSATIVNWALAAHQGNPVDGPTARAFELLGLPLAAWLLSWRPFTRVERFEADEQA